LADEKRNIQGYEELYAIRFAGGEVILAENRNAEDRYMVCDCSRDNPLGAEVYSNAVGGADYAEIMRLFAGRLTARAAALETERETRGIPLQTLTAADYVPIEESDLKSRVVVIKPESLAPEYRNVDYQLALCVGGFGASPYSRGRAVYCKNLFTGETTTWQRSDIGGISPLDALPDWALAKLDALRSKEFVAASDPLGKEQFWRLINFARETAGGWKSMLEPLIESLSRLEEPDIVRFKQIYDAYLDLAYKEKLWAAAAVMHNGCSDDGFTDFRAWLIAQGKDVYLNALADPDSLADLETVQAFGREAAALKYMPDDGYNEAARFESMTYAASDAYERKFGKDADLYKPLGASVLTDREKADIAGEITYAADADKTWTVHSRAWLETLDTLKGLCPKLHALFSKAEPPEQAQTAPQKSGEKESVLEKIRQDRKGKRQVGQQKQKPKKQTKGESEL
jgi:hypothetical protein